ncbi:peptide deformylase [Streptacidiphilus cavernicola]|uniref:Peptide deformylase n=1 Tax=Streptacidiphilus cavernicola TaxID=3342716 RepID=A0ABV6W0P8_9ACTN
MAPTRPRIPGSTGAVHPVTVWADPVLRTACDTVTGFGDQLERLVEDLFATMYAQDGVGLAANQIGVGLRVFVYDCPDDEDVRHLGHLVNPVLVEADGVSVRGEEGCLSLPGLRAQTPRWDRALVRGQDLTGAEVEVEGTGFFARCLQHESDHLDGGVFVDRLSGLRRMRVERSIRGADWYRGAQG